MHDKPTYNPQIHHRHSIRLKGYDYSQVGLYFITICCKDRKYRFGYIKNDEMTLNEYGMIAYNEWIKLTERFSNFELDVFQIMPNHMHAIIALNNVGTGFTPTLYSAHNNAQNKPVRAGFTPAQNFAHNSALYSAQNNDEIFGQSPNGQPQRLTLYITYNDNRATARVVPTNPRISFVIDCAGDITATGFSILLDKSDWPLKVTKKS